MKVIVKGIDLANAVGKVVKAVSVKTPNKVLECIKLSCQGDELVLTATDMEIAIEKTIICQTFESGELLVNGRLFADYTKKLENEEDVELYSQENGRLKIAYSSSEGYIEALPSDEYPVIKKDLNLNSFVINQKAFREIVDKTSFACCQDDARPMLKGCLLEVEGDTLTCVALDGFRLAVCKKNIREVNGSIKAVVPARALGELIKLLNKDEDNVTVIIQDNSLMINVDNTVFLTRLLEGQYIDYKRIIPTEFLTKFRVNKQALSDAIERASIVARILKNIVKFDIHENYIDVSSDSEMGNVKENVFITLEGKDLNVAFNSKFLLDVMRVIDDEFINFNLSTSIAPCVIKPYSDEDYLYLILPIRIG